MLRHFFIKRLRTYSLIMCIPTIVLLLLFVLYAGNSWQKNMENAGNIMLSRIDETVNSSLYNTLYQQDMMMSNAQYNLALKKMLDKEEMDFKDYIFMSALKTLLTNYESAHSYIYSVYLYHNDGARFMTSSSSYLTSESNFYDYDWIEDYEKIPQEVPEYLMRRSVREYSFEDEQEVMTIFKRMTFQDGVIVVNLKQQDYENMVHSLATYKEQLFCFANSDGDIIYVDSEDLKKSTRFQEDILKELVAQYESEGEYEKNDTWLTIDNRKYLIHAKKSNYFNAYQISLIPFSSYCEKLLGTVGWTIPVLLLDAVIIVLLSWITTKRSFGYIDECIEVFAAAEKGVPIESKSYDTKDEYSLILNNVIFMHLANSQMKLSLIEKQHQTQIAELKALQLQINPHFIFNTLQTMDMEIIKNEGFDATAHIMLQELASIIKYAFTRPMELVTLGEELNYLSAYFRIQEIRFQNRIVWYYEIEDEIKEYKIFRLLLQPMIENSISHGLAGKEKILIKVTITKREDMVWFSVVDSGCGMTKDEIAALHEKMNDQTAKNIGLINVNRRLVLNYGEDSRLIIRSKKGVATVIQFRIPVEKLLENAK